MKSTLRSRLLNGQTGDPALLVNLRWQGRAFLIDLGRIDRTSATTLLRIERVFVSHTHMDHFMGFDQLLRVFLARDSTLRIYGPAGIADCVQGKLHGYTWNLTDEYQFAIEVTEISAETLTSWRFAARTKFTREPLGEPQPFRGVAFEDKVCMVEAAPLDHKVVSIAYAVTEHPHMNVQAEALDASGLRPGPWLNQLKRALRTTPAADATIEVAPGDHRSVIELRDRLLTITPGQKIAYTVDTLFSPANAAKIVRLAADADLFYCESPFLDADLDQASKRYHLTAGQAGALARAAGAKRLHVFHFSPRYEGRYGELVTEAHAEYSGGRMQYADLDRQRAAVS